MQESLIRLLADEPGNISDEVEQEGKITRAGLLTHCYLRLSLTQNTQHTDPIEVRVFPQIFMQPWGEGERKAVL